MDLLQRIEWRLYKELKRLRLKNRKPTIIASNCIGTFMYYDMKLPFLSPTINLSFDMNDFVRFVADLSYYLNQPVVPYDDERFEYPCGMIDDIEIRFNHYKTIEEAIEKWEERKKRIDWNNIFIVGIDGDNCSYESMKKFDQLSYVKKVIFTHKKYPEIKSSYYLKGFEEEKGIGRATDFKKNYFIRRYMDGFDYVSFLNGKRK